MELTILHLYPDFMSLYGEYANVTVLRRRLEALGVEVTVRTACRADRPDFDGADMIYMGAGTERRQKLAMECLLPVRQELKDTADRGTLILFTGSAMEVLGASVTDAGGRLWQGLALADFTSVESETRTPEDVVMSISPASYSFFMCAVIAPLEILKRLAKYARLSSRFSNNSSRMPIRTSESSASYRSFPCLKSFK